jgi:hypothetical protein
MFGYSTVQQTHPFFFWDVAAFLLSTMAYGVTNKQMINGQIETDGRQL